MTKLGNVSEIRVHYPIVYTGKNERYTDSSTGRVSIGKESFYTIQTGKNLCIKHDQLNMAMLKFTCPVYVYRSKIVTRYHNNTAVFNWSLVTGHPITWKILVLH